MAYDTVAPLNRLEAIVAALPGIEQVYIGVPSSVGPSVIAYITVGPQVFPKRAGQELQRAARYRVTFAYAVSGDVAAAERSIAACLDNFIRAILGERALANSVLRTVEEPDLTIVADAEYQNMPQEFRRYPIDVTVRQFEVFSV